MEKKRIEQEIKTIYEAKAIEVAKEREHLEPITRGCHAAAHGGCFCTGACHEIIGWREKGKEILINKI